MNSNRFLDHISNILIEREETLSIAESVTSGFLQQAFSQAHEATQFYQGGITVYNTGQKARHLKVDPIHAEKTNCVSEIISQTMATKVCDMFSSHWGIAVTGYAAPVPAWGVKSVLFAWFAIAYKGNIVVSKKLSLKKTKMETIQKFYARNIVKGFYQYLKKQKSE